jgi:hypothetical protein
MQRAATRPIPPYVRLYLHTIVRNPPVIGHLEPSECCHDGRSAWPCSSGPLALYKGSFLSTFRARST